MTNQFELPTDLFNPDRLPDRDENGFVCHPDHDLIFEKLGVDDEGETAHKFITGMGYETYIVDFEDDAPEEVKDHYFGDGAPDLSGWQPSKPDGEGWLLIAIYQHDDGAAAGYLRKTA